MLTQLNNTRFSKLASGFSPQSVCATMNMQKLFTRQAHTISIPLILAVGIAVLHHSNAIPFSKAQSGFVPRFIPNPTQPVVDGQKLFTKSSMSALPIVAARNAKQFLDSNKSEDAIVAIPPVSFGRSRQQKNSVRVPFKVPNGTPSVSATPTPIPGFDENIAAQSDQEQADFRTTVESRQTTVPFENHSSSSQRAPNPSRRLFRKMLQDKKELSTVSNVASVNPSAPEIHPHRSQGSFEILNEFGLNYLMQEKNGLHLDASSNLTSSQPELYQHYMTRIETLPSMESSPMYIEGNGIRKDFVNPHRKELTSSASHSNVKGNDENFYSIQNSNSSRAQGGEYYFKSSGNFNDENNKLGEMPPLERRIYSTNLLPGSKTNNPSLFPPGFGRVDALNKSILDVGAHIGDDYTIHGVTAGHTVIAFEPSPAVLQNFRKYMSQKGIPFSVVNHQHRLAAPTRKHTGITNEIVSMVTQTPIRQVSLSDGASGHGIRSENTVTAPQAQLFLIPFALSNVSGLAGFFESNCKTSRCGKVNRIPVEGVDSVKGNIVVQKYRLDDLTLPIDMKKIWFLKVDVEGHELEVLQGARNLIRRSNLEYIVLEFSPNGRSGVQWGLNLLTELFEQGFTCFHLRGFGKCHNNSIKSPSLKCNFPFPLNNASMAPSFLDYTRVFQISDQAARMKPRMSDLMCRRRRTSNRTSTNKL